MEYVNLIKQLENVSVAYNNKTIFLIDTLKKTPRSGKMVRFAQYGISLPCRSLYNHIVSLPAQAEFFLSHSHYNIDKKKLAALCIFHDLSEAIIGDVPDFTPEQLAVNTYMNHSEKMVAEIKANNLLIEVLPKNIRELFKEHLRVLEEKTSDLYKFFYMIDKTDPIIAIWRYIFLMRDKILIDPFLTATNDFFINPTPQKTCLNERTLEIVRFLQNKENAKEYYLCPEKFKDYAFTALVENREMQFV
jgi:5'-deoxynucleotidase YfbR-like HD superfamily hydrolase